MAYATNTELKNRLGIIDTNVTRDTVLDALLKAASEQIDKMCNRSTGFLSSDTASYKYYDGKGKTYVLIDECTSITDVAVKDSATASTYTAWTSPATQMSGDGDWIAFRGDPEMPDFNATPYTGIMIDPNGDYTYFPSGLFSYRSGFRPTGDIVGRAVATVRVNAKWGYATTAPYVVKEAVIVQASRWWKRGESGWADTTASADFGQLQFRQAIDPDVKAMIIEARLIRPAIG